MSEKLLIEKTNKDLYPTTGVRLSAAMINLLCLLLIMIPISKLLPAPDLGYIKIDNNLNKDGLLKLILSSKLLQYIFSSLFLMFTTGGLLIITQWHKYDTDLGKYIYGIKIVDSVSFTKPTLKQYVIKYICYVISIITFNLDILFGSFKKDRRNVRDILSRTTLISPKMIDPNYKKKRVKQEFFFVLGLIVIFIILRKIFGVV